MTDPGVPDSAAAKPSGSPGRVRSIRGGSRATLVGSAVLALVVGLIAGGAIGWKVEQRRVKDDVKQAKADAFSRVAKTVRPFGVVTAVDGNSVTIRLQTGARGSRTFTLTSDTTINRGIAAEPSSIVKGATVLVRPGNEGNAQPVAAEVIVLPPWTTFGKR